MVNKERSWALCEKKKMDSGKLVPTREETVRGRKDFAHAVGPG